MKRSGMSTTVMLGNCMARTALSWCLKRPLPCVGVRIVVCTKSPKFVMATLIFSTKFALGLHFDNVFVYLI